MRVGDLELFDVDGLPVSELDVVKEHLSAPQIHLVLADSHMMLQDHVHVYWPELVQDGLQVGGLPDIGLLLWSERVLLDPLTSLDTGDQGDEFGVNLL